MPSRNPEQQDQKSDALPHARVTVTAYNAELRDTEGFIGDRASKRAFHSILEDWRDRLRGSGGDPLGEPGETPDKRELDGTLRDGDPQAAGLVHGAVEEFAGELSTVTQRLLRHEGWEGTERIVVGGGFRDSRVGELAIGRAAVLLRAGGSPVAMRPVRHHPDAAALIGTAHLAPPECLHGHDAILGIDIGGTSIRVGVVRLNLDRSPDLAAAEVHQAELWAHAEDKPDRDAAVRRLVDMLRERIGRAGQDGLRLVPRIGIGCPGLIRRDGSIERGGQNLPGGNWEDPGFNLGQCLRAAIPEISGRELAVAVHNDAVVQGLSEAPFMHDVARWAVLTIGTGLGNACFRNVAG